MRFIYSIILAFIVLSCSESKMLQKSLGNFKAPIGYLHDSKIINGPKIDSVIVRLNNTSLDSITKVSKINSLVLPFLVYNYNEVNMKVKLGQSSIEQNYNDFFDNSIIEESKRSAHFGISSLDSSDSLYTLDIKIDTCSIQSKYQRSTTILFLFFAYAVSYQEMGFPAEVNLKVSTTLRKGKVVIAEKTYAIKRTQPFINPTGNRTQHLRADFTANMVESLSLSTKECIEDIIGDLNRTMQKTRMN